MAITAADVLDGARDLHPSFDPKSQPDTVLVRQIQRDARRLATKVIAIRPEQVPWSTQTTALPLAVFANGISLPSHLLVTQVTALRAGGTSPQDDTPIPLVNTQQRTRWGQPWPSAFIMSGTLYLAATAADWLPYASVTVRYVPVPSVTSSASAIGLDDDALTPLVLSLGAFMATRRQGMSDAPPVGMWQAEAALAEDQYMQRVQRQMAGTDTVVQDSYGDNGGW